MDGKKEIIGFDEFQERYNKLAKPEFINGYTQERLAEGLVECLENGCSPRYCLTDPLLAEKTKDGITVGFIFEAIFDDDKKEYVGFRYSGYFDA